MRLAVVPRPAEFYSLFAAVGENAVEAARLVDEVLSFLAETPEAFIRRRHLALQAQGFSNDAIFTQLAVELERLRFRAPPLTARQIRRIIYG